MIEQLPETKECRICGIYIRFDPQKKYYINANKKGNRHSCVEDLQYRVSRLERAVFKK
jgi:hypothetical protein